MTFHLRCNDPINMPQNLIQTLDQFIDNSIALHRQQTGDLPLTPFDPEWPSPCLHGSPSADGLVHWRPVLQESPSDMFERLADALEFPLHEDIRIWYSRYWSDPLPAQHAQGTLSLLFCWNSDDMERLRANLLGHLLAKRKQRQPPSLFFACTDGEEFMTLDNADGSVWLERPGRKPIQRLANSLAEFITQLEPLPITPTP